MFVILAASAIVSSAHAAKCDDDACMAAVAAQIDAEIAALSPADRAIIERVGADYDASAQGREEVSGDSVPA